MFVSGIRFLDGEDYYHNREERRITHLDYILRQFKREAARAKGRVSAWPGVLDSAAEDEEEEGQGPSKKWRRKNQ